MALRNAVIALFNAVGDGTSTVFNVDLKTDAYAFSPSTPLNYDSHDVKDVSSTNPGAYSATISGHIVTITFSTPPSAGSVSGVAVWLIF